MTERYLHDAFDITKYALSKLTDQDRDLLIQFDDFCQIRLGQLELDFDPEIGKMIEKEGYEAIPGSEEVVNKWNKYLEEGVRKSIS
jgi:hypothetical protein